MARDYLLPVLGKRRLVEIRPQQIGSVLQVAQELGLGDQTRRHIYNLMHKMFEDAVEHFELLPRNPVLKRCRPMVPRKEREFLAPSESRTLLEVSSGHFLGPAIWLGLLAGLRPSEIQALEFKHLDFERKRISIRQAYKGRVDRIEPFPKQKDWSSAPMTDGLASYLRSLSGGKGPGDFVASGQMGGMLNYSTFLHGLKRLCKKAA